MNPKPIIFFDGVCNLCNASVQFVIRHDRNAVFVFAPLQGKTAKNILPPEKISASDLQSFILHLDGKIFTQSTAALKVARRLDGWPRMLYGFIIVPAFIRNAVYRMIAKNRYRWFGKKDACMLPTPSIKARFLD